MDRLLRKSSWL